MADFESVVSNIISVFVELPLNLLDEEWTELAWNEKYIDVPPPSGTLDLSDDALFALSEQVSAVCNICQEWYRVSSVFSSDEDNEGENCNLWKILMENGVHHKALLGWLYMGVIQGNTAVASIVQKNAALQMAKLYFNLIVVPGSKAYGIFQGGLLQSAVHCFRLPDKKVAKLLGNESSANRVPSQIAKGSRQGGRKKQASQNEEPFSGESSENQQSDEDDISHEMLCDHLSVMTDSMKDLVLMLQSSSMQSCAELTEFVIQQLCELMQMDIPGSQVTLNHVPNPQKNYPHYKYLTMYTYLALKLLCLPQHGDPVGNFTFIAKHLMPHILMLPAGNTTTISRAVSNIRDNAVSFVLHMLEGQKEDRESWEEVVYILVQNLALQVIDKTDFRLRTSHAIVTLMDTLSSKLFEQLTDWVGKLAHSQQSNRRVFALELIAALIWNERVGNRRADLLLAALRRCNDRAAAVKTRALGFLAGVTGEPPSRWMPLLQGTVHTEQADQQEGNVAVQVDHFMHMMKMLLLRLDDEKVHVRRTALGVLENVLSVGGDLLKEEYVRMLYERCLDPAVLVRKQALQCLTRCLQAHSHCDLLLRRWVKGVLPAVFDVEASVQEKAVEMVESALLAPLVYGNAAGSPELSWRLLGLLTEDSFCGYDTYLQRAVRTLAHGNKLRHGMLKRLRPHLGGPSDASVWLLLSRLALFSDLGEADFALDYWKQACDGAQQASSKTLHNVLLVIRKTAHHLPPERLKEVIGEFEQKLEAMTLSVEVVPKMVDCLSALTHTLCKDDDKWLRANNSWGAKMLEHCSSYLSPMLLERVMKPEDNFEEQVIAHLVLMGEAAQAAPKAVTERMQELVEICLSAPLPCHTGKLAPTATDSPKKRSRRSKNIGLAGPTVTQRIRAHAFVTLGKMCLQNEAFAKKTVAALAKELSNTDDIIIRNNIIFIFADLCKRYAVLVDPYLPCIMACLSDHDPDLRHMTLTTLFQLLQQDFVKLRGPLFYHLLSTLVDKEEAIRQLSSYGLGVQVYARHPHIFYQRFIETLYYFNSAGKGPQSSDGSCMVSSLTGEANAERRMTIFRFLLDHMNDEQRFMLNLNITQNVLAPCANEQDLLMRSCPDLLKDGLAILCCDEIKLRSIMASDESAEDDLGQAMLLAARKNILSHFVKRNVVENVVPVVISLKHRLEAERSPLLRHLLMFLRELMRDYRNEVKEILSIDRITASEVEFDLKKLEEEEKAMEERARRKKSTAVVPTVPQMLRTPRNMDAFLQMLQESARKIKESAKKARLHANKDNPHQDKANEKAGPERGSSEDIANQETHQLSVGGGPGKECGSEADEKSQNQSEEGPTGKCTAPAVEAKNCETDAADENDEAARRKQQTPRDSPRRSTVSRSLLKQNENIAHSTSPRITALRSGMPGKQKQKSQNHSPGVSPNLATPTRASNRIRTPRRRFPLEEMVEEASSHSRNTTKEKQNSRSEFKVPQPKKGPDVETSTPLRTSGMPPHFPSDVSAIN